MTKDMTTGNPLKIILLFSMPVLFGNIFQQFYNMFDTIIVGQFLGEDALAAVGATGSIMFFVLGFAMGIAQGFGVMMSQAFGAKDIPRLKRYMTNSLFLAVIVSLVLTVVTVIFSKQLLLFLHTPENILDMSNTYIRIIFMGIICSMFYNIASGILRAVGDSKTPLYFLIFSSFLNIGLDLLFIIVFKSGVGGAAIATVISQGISAVLCYLYMFWKFDILRLSKNDFVIEPQTLKQLMSFGIPMALNYSLIAIGSMILQSAVNVFGSSVVASFTAASKVEQIISQPMPALGTTMGTYCGQNLGAGKYDRIFKGMRIGLIIGVCSAGFAGLICAGFGKYLVRLFLSNPTDTVITYASQYLGTISIFFVFLSFIYLYRTSLQGLGRNIFPMISGILEMICRIGTVVLLLDTHGFWAVRLASPVAWIGAGVPLMITYLIWKRKIKKTILAEPIVAAEN